MADFLSQASIRKFRCDSCKHHLFSLNDKGETAWVNPVIAVNSPYEKWYWQDGDRVLIRCDKCKKINYPIGGALKLIKDEEVKV